MSASKQCHHRVLRPPAHIGIGGLADDEAVYYEYWMNTAMHTILTTNDWSLTDTGGRG